MDMGCANRKCGASVSRMKESERERERESEPESVRRTNVTEIMHGRDPIR